MIDLIKTIFSTSFTVFVGAVALLLTILFVLVSICFGRIRSLLLRNG